MDFLKFSFFEINFSNFRLEVLAAESNRSPRFENWTESVMETDLCSAYFKLLRRPQYKRRKLQTNKQPYFSGLKKKVNRACLFACLHALGFERDEWQIFGLSNSADSVFMLFVTSELQGHISFPQ